MQSSRPLARKKNLLLAFDAFETLYRPNIQIPQAYGQAALRHGINCVGDTYNEHLPYRALKEEFRPVRDAFRKAYKQEAAQNPNYGKVTGLGAEQWWTNVIKGTFQPFLKPQQEVPEALVKELWTRYSSGEGYVLYPDVLPFFRMIKSPKLQHNFQTPWRWDKTVVGIITNSDDRVPSILTSLGLKVSDRRVGVPAQRTYESAVQEDISFVVLSYDVGHEKPHHRVYDAATQLLEETLAEDADASSQSIDDWEKLYVGDSLEEDYFGAVRAGWNAVYIDRRQWRKEGQLAKARFDVLRDVPLHSCSSSLLEKKKKKSRAEEPTGIEDFVDINLIQGLSGLARWPREAKTMKTFKEANRRLNRAFQAKEEEKRKEPERKRKEEERKRKEEERKREEEERERKEEERKREEEERERKEEERKRKERGKKRKEKERKRNEARKKQRIIEGEKENKIDKEE